MKQLIEQKTKSSNLKDLKASKPLHHANIGIKVKQPSKICKDANCPFHGKLKVRGQMFEGEVISTNASKTAKIEFKRLHSLPKYERFEKRRTRLHTHNPECINAKEGDIVKVIACRPISKTKNFVIIEVK